MSIHQKGLLVSLQIGSIPQSKKVRRASEKLERDNNTAPKQAAVVSRLFAKQDIKGLQSVVSAARTKFKDLTLPYGRGQGLIPSNKYFDFLEEMTSLKAQFEAERRYLLDNIEGILKNAEEVNGSLFDRNNYPELGDLSEAMYFSIEVNPVPAANEFDKLADLTPEEIEVLKREAVINANSKTEAAIRDLFERLFKTLQHAADRLTDEESGECKIFRNTLIGNIEKALHAAETLNINDDEGLKSLTEEVKRVIVDLTADDLRKDKELRKETAQKAADLASKIGDLF